MCVQAGTLSGNPLAMTAGIKTLQILERPGTYEYLDKITGRLVNGIIDAAHKAGHACCGGHIGGTPLLCSIAGAYVLMQEPISHQPSLYRCGLSHPNSMLRAEVARLTHCACIECSQNASIEQSFDIGAAFVRIPASSQQCESMAALPYAVADLCLPACLRTFIYWWTAMDGQFQGLMPFTMTSMLFGSSATAQWTIVLFEASSRC